MLDALRHSRALRRLESGRERTVAAYAVELAAKRGKVHWEDLHDIQGRERWELQLVDEEIASLVTRRLLFLANRDLLPLPAPDSDHWETGSQTGQRYLTRAGMAALKASIRQERREHWSDLQKWAAAAVGVIGALTGLASVVLRK